MKRAKIAPNGSVPSQTDASSANATPFVPPETKIEWQEETAPTLAQTASPRPVVMRMATGAAAAPAPIPPSETVSAPSDSPDGPHTLAGISSFDSVDTERDNRSLLYMGAAAALLTAALLVLGLGVHLSNQRVERGKAEIAQAAQAARAAQPQNAAAQKADVKPVEPQAAASQSTGAKPAADPSPAVASAPQASAAQSAAAKPAVAQAVKAKATPRAKAPSASGAGRRISASLHQSHPNVAHVARAPQQPKVQVVNGVKHYSDMD